jgi:hypothetical protein
MPAAGIHTSDRDDAPAPSRKPGGRDGEHLLPKGDVARGRLGIDRSDTEEPAISSMGVDRKGRPGMGGFYTGAARQEYLP